MAETIGRDPAACAPARQPRPQRMSAPPGRAIDMPREQGLEIAEAFFAASRSGDMSALRGLLADDVTTCRTAAARCARPSQADRRP